LSIEKKNYRRLNCEKAWMEKPPLFVLSYVARL
jgi:hypothetical protein